MSKLLISVDYDGTYSADPDAFDLIIAEFQANGHECIIVTARGDNHPVTINTNLGLKVYYTEGEDKDPFMRENHNIEVDIWIEDRPQSVGKTDNWRYNKEDRYWYQSCNACDGKGEYPVVSSGSIGPTYTCSDCFGSGEWVPS